MSGRVDVVVPHGVDDVRHPSGGNTYDARIIEGLAGAGWTVRTHRVPGTWPRVGACDVRALAFALTPRGTGASTPVVVDGMLAAAAGDVVRHAARMRPVVVLSHMLFGLGNPALASSERSALSAARAVITVSVAAAAALRTYDVPAGRVHVVPPGADHGTASTPSATGERMLCVAAVSHAKGHDTLIDALSRLRRDVAWSCTCVGALDADPVFTHRLGARITASGIADRVTLSGPVAHTAVDTAYAGADVVILPSRAETWGIVLTEALARGIPVIATDVGGVREAVGKAPDGTVPGMLVPADDPTALADALSTWLGDAAMRARLRSAAAARRDTVAGWDATTAGVAAVLHAMVTAGPGTARPTRRMVRHA